MVKQIYNSPAVHNDSLTLTLDNFSEFQKIISDTPLHPRASLWRIIACENRYVTQLLFHQFITSYLEIWNVFISLFSECIFL